MKLDQRLVDAAIELMNTRFPKDQWGGLRRCTPVKGIC